MQNFDFQIKIFFQYYTIYMRENYNILQTASWGSAIKSENVN